MVTTLTDCFSDAPLTIGVVREYIAYLETIRVGAASNIKDELIRNDGADLKCMTMLNIFLPHHEIFTMEKVARWREFARFFDQILNEEIAAAAAAAPPVAAAAGPADAAAPAAAPRVFAGVRTILRDRCFDPDHYLNEAAYNEPERLVELSKFSFINALQLDADRDHNTRRVFVSIGESPNKLLFAMENLWRNVATGTDYADSFAARYLSLSSSKLFIGTHHPQYETPANARGFRISSNYCIDDTFVNALSAYIAAPGPRLNSRQLKEKLTLETLTNLDLAHCLEMENAFAADNHDDQYHFHINKLAGLVHPTDDQIVNISQKLHPDDVVDLHTNLHNVHGILTDIDTNPYGMPIGLANPRADVPGTAAAIKAAAAEGYESIQHMIEHHTAAFNIFDNLARYDAYLRAMQLSPIDIIGSENEIYIFMDYINTGTNFITTAIFLGMIGVLLHQFDTDRLIALYTKCRFYAYYISDTATASFEDDIDRDPIYQAELPRIFRRVYQDVRIPFNLIVARITDDDDKKLVHNYRTAEHLNLSSHGMKYGDRCGPSIYAMISQNIHPTNDPEWFNFTSNCNLTRVLMRGSIDTSLGDAGEMADARFELNAVLPGINPPPPAAPPAAPPADGAHAGDGDDAARGGSYPASIL